MNYNPIFLFKCTYLSDKKCIFAENEDEAKRIFCKNKGICQDASGLQIEQIPFIQAKRERHSAVKRYYCGNCTKEVGILSSFCRYCNAYLGDSM